MITPDDSAGADYTGLDHGFGEDNALADEIMQQDWYDDSPSVHGLPKNWRKWELPTTVEGLSPDMAAPIAAQLIGLTPEQRATREPQLVRAAIEAKSREVRISTGVGADATPLAKAQVNLAYREQELERRIADWQAKLDDVSGAKAVADPATGQTMMQPVYRLTGEGRHIATLQVQELTRQLSVLKGPEGDKELQEALRESVAQAKAARQRVEDADEVKSRVQQQMREDDINARVAVQLKHRRASDNYSASL